MLTRFESGARHEVDVHKPERRYKMFYNLTKSVWIRLFQGLVLPKRHSVAQMINYCRARVIR